MKAFSISLFLFFSLLPCFAQESYQIDDYGIYIIDDTGMHKVPHHQKYTEYSFVGFRDEFAIFCIHSPSYEEYSLYFLYDTKKHIASEFLKEVYSSKLKFMGIQKNENTIFLISAE